MTDEAESKTKWVILKGINYEDDIYVQKTLASRIFTIQFSDADLFAVHAVYGKAFKVSPVYACGQKCSGWFKKKNNQKKLQFNEGQS